MQPPHVLSTPTGSDDETCPELWAEYLGLPAADSSQGPVYGHEVPSDQQTHWGLWRAGTFSTWTAVPLVAAHPNTVPASKEVVHVPVPFPVPVPVPVAYFEPEQAANPAIFRTDVKVQRPKARKTWNARRRGGGKEGSGASSSWEVPLQPLPKRKDEDSENFESPPETPWMKASACSTTTGSPVLSTLASTVGQSPVSPMEAIENSTETDDWKKRTITSEEEAYLEREGVYTITRTLTNSAGKTREKTVPVDKEVVRDTLTAFSEQGASLVINQGGLSLEGLKLDKKQVGQVGLVIQFLLQAGPKIDWIGKLASMLMDQLVKQLSGEANLQNLIKACNHKESNFVISKFIEVGTPEQIERMIHSFCLMKDKNLVLALVGHAHGCRSPQRLVEYHGRMPKVQALFESWLETYAESMCEGEFPHYVVLSIFKTSMKEGWSNASTLRQYILRALGLESGGGAVIREPDNVKKALTHEWKSHVLKGMVLAMVENKKEEALSSAIMQTVMQPEVCLELTKNEFGQYFIHDVLVEKRQSFPDEYARLVEHLCPHVPELKEMRYGNLEGKPGKPNKVATAEALNHIFG